MEKHMLILATVGGFLYKFEQNNVELLQRLGYTVHYASNTSEQNYLFEEQELLNKGIKLHHIDIKSSPYRVRSHLKAFRQLVDIVVQNNISLVHCHTPMGGALGRMLGRRFGQDRLKVIYTAHGFHFYQGAPLHNNLIYYGAERWLARHTDILITINKEDFQKAQKFHLRPQGRVYQIPGVGLDLDKFKPLTTEERQQKRQELGIGEDKFFIVTTGKLSPCKNHAVIPEVLVKMQEAGTDLPQISWAICGEGHLRDRMEAKIQAQALEDVLSMYGYVSDISQVVGCADAFFFPSKREGLGMAALEALAMGVPVVAADNRGTREYMVSGKNGFVCRPDSVKGYAEAIEKIRDLSQKQHRQMQTDCRESVKPFDQKYTIEIMQDVYHELDERIEREAAYGTNQNECHHGCI